MEDPESGRPLKRFKSYQATLKSVHLPSASAQSKLDEDIQDSESHFHNSLEHWRQLNVSPAFVRFTGQVHGLSASVPLLLHHSQEIILLWIDATTHSDDDSLRAFFDLLQKLVHDLRDTLLPSYSPLLEALLAHLPDALSADTLTVLLATLSLFFKHLLNTGSQLLTVTWASLIDILPRCNPDVQRAVAEVWATVLRRCRGETRESAVDLVVQGLESAADACAWILVYAFKSVSHTLHTCSSALFDGLMSVYLSSINQTRIQTLMRRVITALIHHCDKAEQFSPISDHLVSRFTSAAAHSQDELSSVIDLISIACSVRRGSRMTQKQLSTIISRLAQIEVSANLRRHFLVLATASLLAGEMPVWMGPGRKLVEMSWEDPSRGLELSGTLSELQWGGWRLIELPFTLKHTTQAFDAQPRLTLRLLAELSNGGRLDDADDAWICRMATLVQDRLGSWDMSKEKNYELGCILSLLPLLPSLAPEIIRVSKSCLESAENKDANQVNDQTRALLGKIFGSCLMALAKIPNKYWSQQIDMVSLLTCALRCWGQCEVAIGGLVAMSRKIGTADHPIPIADVYPLLQASILSHSSGLRHKALELLAAPILEKNQSHVVIQRCLQGEDSSFDFQGARERILKITGVCQVIKDGDGVGADICARWLIAQLKVNLRPLWAPAIKALGEYSHRFGDSAWRLLFTELKTVMRGDLLMVPDPLSSDVEHEVGRETERSWRDPSSSKLYYVVDKLQQGTVDASFLFQIPSDRLDVANYEVQLLHAMGELATLTRKHNTELVRQFLSFASPELPTKPPRKRLGNWLTLFSKLDNPKAFHQSSTLMALYRSILSHPDHDLQSIALTCVLKYKSPHLIPYEANLLSFLDNTKWRDELTTFDIAGIEEGDRGEAVDTIIRLFFGLMLERHGRTRGADRRASLLDAMGGCREEELKLLVDLMLEPLGLTSTSSDFSATLSIGLPEKQRTGFLNLLGDVLTRMGSRLVLYWPSLLVATIKLTAEAQASLGVIPDTTMNVEVEEINENSLDLETIALPSKSRTTRAIRQLGIKRITDFYRCDSGFDFGPYISHAFSDCVSPRLPALEHENTQSPSAILDLFHLWSTRQEFVYFLVDHDDRILPRTYACLRAVNVKPAVVSRIFDMIEHIIAMSMDDSGVADRVLKPHMSSLLDALAGELPTTSSAQSNLLHRQVGILSEIARFVCDSSQAQRLLQQFLPLLKRPSKVIPEKTKVHLLKVTQGLIPVVPEFRNHASTTYAQLYDMFSKLFQTLRGRPARTALIDAFNQLSAINSSLKKISGFLASLNAFSSKGIDEPDFGRRMQAFTELNENVYSQLSPPEWQPILYNMLHFIQDPDELAVRTNAAFSLKRFLDVLSRGTDGLEALFIRVLYPGLKNGLLSKIESVRNEVLGVLAYGVLKCNVVSSLSELRPLLADGDAEANFFNNVHHIQVHRRTRAIRRLVEHVDMGSVRSMTLSDIFVPLIGHFITNASTTDHILVDVAIAATGSMARRLNWGAYNALVRQYMKVIKEKTPAQRACVRSLVAVLENFHFPMDDVIMEPQAANHQGDRGEEDPSSPEKDDAPLEVQRLVVDTQGKKISDAVNNRLLPSLILHLEEREGNEDALRIPISVGIVHVALHLPKATRDTQITRLLTVMCQVFRSKSYETRTLTRETICKIAIALGPSYLHKIITELRAALLRGPHLHVLATVVHALLVHVTSPGVFPSFENLDACTADVAHVSAEVIFGQSGRDVHSEGFKTTTTEVRGSASKGLDAFATIAKYISPSSISALLSPIRGIMHETGASKTLQIVDDLLRRISGGLNANAHLTPTELLLLCHTLIKQNSRFLKEAPRPMKGRAKGHFIVQTKRRLDQNENYYSLNSFRFVAFGLDLFNTAFRRGRFDLQDPQLMSRLEPMVDVIGNTLYSQDALVVIQGLKATVHILKCPLRAVEKSLSVFTRQTLEIVRQAGNTESEVAQSAFRALAVIIRDCDASQIQEKDLVYLLEVLAPDLEEPNRQGAIFSLLKAIVSRKFVVAEIYEIMDKVAQIMVTNQSSQVQELCRVVFLQFLLDYPQGKGRLRNQMTFLVQNLSYVFESGRRSVMELLSAVFSKFETGLLRDHADLFFVALVMVIANDDSSKCREMAAELIKRLLTRLDISHHRTIISHLHSWSSQKTRLQLSRVSAQVYGLVVDTLQQEIIPYLPGLLEDINDVLKRSTAELRELESSENNVKTMDIDLEWQLPYHALNVISKVLRVHPELVHEAGKVDWFPIGAHLLFPHAWVRNASSRLVGTLFNASPPGAQEDGLTSLSGLIEIARKSALQLKSDTLESTLSLQVVKNLFYIGKYFCSIFKSRTTQEVAAETVVDEAADNVSADQETEDKLENIRDNPLPWLFSKLSYQARSAWIARRNRSAGQNNWAEQPLAIFRWFAAMSSHMEPAMLQIFLVHILSPVYRIIDDDTVRDTQIEDLRTLAQELVDLVQTRVGASKFAEVYNQIRQGIVAIRRERRIERVVQATVNPQAAARRKIKRNLSKKDNRGRKDRAFADGKIRKKRRSIE